MADIIVLSGQAHSGKTTTMRRLFERIRDSQDVVVRFESGFNQGGDFIAIIEVSGRTIGFISGGDYIDDFRNQFNEISRHNVDVLICASRSKNRDNSVYNFLFENLPEGNRVVLCLSTFPTDNLDMMSNNISEAIILYLNGMNF